MFRILVDHILLIQSSANNGPFENYRKTAKVDELFRVIRTVHQDQLGIQKHTKRYSLSLFIVWNDMSSNYCQDCNFFDKTFLCWKLFLSFLQVDLLIWFKLWYHEERYFILETFVEHQLAVSIILIRYKILVCEKFSRCRKWLNSRS